MNKYLKVVLPTPAVFISFFILPLVFGVYFLLSRYSDQFIRSEGIDYVAIQTNVLAQIYITGQLADWVTRFMDFAFWGVLASIGVLIFWAISAARVTVRNHAVQQGFVNFKTDQRSWTNQLIIVSVIKVLLAAVILYSVLAFIVSAIPKLAGGVAAAISNLNGDSISKIGLAVVLMIFLQTLIVFCVKLFKHVETS